MRRGAKPAKARVEAKSSAVRKARHNEGTRIRQLQKQLEKALKGEAEALEQQTATSEILRVISASPTDARPVFETIVASAGRLCGAESAVVYRFEGGAAHFAAHYNLGPEAVEAYGRRFPRPLHQTDYLWRIADGSVLNIADIEQDPRMSTSVRADYRSRGARSAVWVPMVREGQALGAISVTHRNIGAFSRERVQLLKTFTDQAVIAIENVRLFTELQEKNLALTESHAQVTEALEQQTATSEILRVISSSRTNVQPVFDTIAEHAVKLCGADVGVVSIINGEYLQLGAMHGLVAERAEATRRAFPMPLDAESTSARAVRSRAVAHFADAIADPHYQYKDTAQVGRWRATLAVPMLRGVQVIGAIFVARATPGVFRDSQIALLQTFADQAVIAIENVRLFTELQVRTGELTHSVAKLTALGEVSRAVSSTLDVETVLETIVARASQLAGADGCAIYEYDAGEQVFHVRATHNFDAPFVSTLRAMPLHKGEGLGGRATKARQPIQIADITAPGAYESQIRDLLIGAGYRAALSVPLLREEQVIGSLSLVRKEPGEFSPEVVDVLKTFATQSALAIQNARLFREIADKSRQLEAASRHKSEFLANMSHELRTPLNAIIGFSEVLVDRMFGELNDKQEEYLKDIYASGQHLLSLINDILDLSKIEAGRMELEVTDFDLPDAIDNALILVRERATRREIALGRTIDEHLGMVRGDERKVKQVLLNLLSNALKFTPEGGRIDVNAHVHDGVAEVSVADTGVGIAPEDQEAVFEEFRQVGAADKKVEGTGLGLALSRKFIELHGGRIWVKSQAGHGSTFTFTLPVRRED